MKKIKKLLTVIAAAVILYIVYIANNGLFVNEKTVQIEISKGMSDSGITGRAFISE